MNLQQETSSIRAVEMMNQLINVGLNAVVAKMSGSLAAAASHNHPLAGYPLLRSALERAERNGALAAERRKLSHHWPSQGSRLSYASPRTRSTLTISL